MLTPRQSAATAAVHAGAALCATLLGPRDARAAAEAQCSAAVLAYADLLPAEIRDDSHAVACLCQADAASAQAAS